MDPPVTEKPTLPTWKEHWGDYAKVPPVAIRPVLTILLPADFVRGTVMNLFKAAGRPAPDMDLGDFANECLVAWHEEFRARKDPASSERRSTIRRFIPTPERGDYGVQVLATAEDKVTDVAFGRSVANRFAPTVSGARMALREALLMGLERVRREADERKGATAAKGS